MKRSLYLYLFIIALLMNIFTYAYYSKQTAFEKQQFITSTGTMRDSITLMRNQLGDANYFTLERNENAREYLADYDTTEIVKKVSDTIMSLNDGADGNSLIPYDKINGQKFIVNKIRVLNHRWVIADFSDGIVWGELLLKYFVEEKGDITFERIDSQIYQKQQVSN